MKHVGHNKHIKINNKIINLKIIKGGLWDMVLSGHSNLDAISSCWGALRSFLGWDFCDNLPIAPLFEPIKAKVLLKHARGCD